jgi:hypothetical protein
MQQVKTLHKEWLMQQGVGMAGNALANLVVGTSTDKTNTINKRRKINPTTGRNIYAV